MIKPREVVPIELTFKPENRLHPFTNELNIQFTNGEIKKLLLVKGACHGMEVKFMEEVVSFGTVV